MSRPGDAALIGLIRASQQVGDLPDQIGIDSYRHFRLDPVGTNGDRRASKPVWMTLSAK
jgi:hypothetical protein